MLKKFKREPNPITKEVYDLISDMKDMDRTSEEYHKCVTSVKTLMEANKSKIDWNVVITNGVSLTTVLCILHYEKLGFITSKALGFVVRGRV